jgi:hypothetical protein
MTKLHWPSWRFRAHPETGGLEKRVFHSQSEFMNAGEGWVQSPADIGKSPEKPAEAPTAAKAPKATEAAPEAASPATEAPAASSETQSAKPSGPIDFEGLDDAALRDIAEKAGIKIDKRWGRRRLEDALRNS